MTSFAAREVFVGTLATIYSVGSDEEETIQNRMAAELNDKGERTPFQSDIWYFTDAFLCLCHAMYEYLGHCKTGNQFLEMAFITITFYEYYYVSFWLYGLSTIGLNDTTVLAYLILATALAYLAHRFIMPIPFWFPKKKSSKNCGTDCGC